MQKKLFKKISIAFIVALLIVCILLIYIKNREDNHYHKNNIYSSTDIAPWSDRAELSEPQRKALVNGKKYIDNSSFHNKTKIDYQKVSFEEVTEDLKENIEYLDSARTSSDNLWLIVFGDTRGHNFASLIIDKNNLEVIGYLPTK